MSIQFGVSWQFGLQGLKEMSNNIKKKSSFEKITLSSFMHLPEQLRRPPDLRRRLVQKRLELVPRVPVAPLLGEVGEEPKRVAGGILRRERDSIGLFFIFFKKNTVSRNQKNRAFWSKSKSIMTQNGCQNKSNNSNGTECKLFLPGTLP